jgi:hypothetical protein
MCSDEGSYSQGSQFYPTPFEKRMIGTFYSIHVRRKTREWQIELAVKQGDPPQRGEVIEVNLQGENDTQ